MLTLICEHPEWVVGVQPTLVVLTLIAWLLVPRVWPTLTMGPSYFVPVRASETVSHGRSIAVRSHRLNPYAVSA